MTAVPTSTKEFTYEAVGAGGKRVKGKIEAANEATAAQQLKQQGIIIASREGRLRASPHFYNNEQQLDRLVAALVHP